MRHLAVAALVAGLGLPVAASAQEWFVIVSYVDHAPYQWDDAVLDRARYLEGALAPCGLQVWWEFTAKFEGFNPNGRGTVFVIDAVPGLSKGQAQHVLAQTQPCIADAYIKQGRYYGE